jgi:hypothetical protein
MKYKKYINNEFLELFNLINKSKKKFLIISIILFLISSVFTLNIKPMQIGSISLLPATVAKSGLYKTPEYAFKELDFGMLGSESIELKCNSGNLKVSIDENFIGISYKSREKEEIYECLTNVEKYIQNKEYAKFSYAIHLIDKKLDFYKELHSQNTQNKSELKFLEIEKEIMELTIRKKSKFDTHQTERIGSIQITNNQHYPRLIIIIIILLLSLILSMIAELFQSSKYSQSTLK